jgi:hypothetical protein
LTYLSPGIISWAIIIVKFFAWSNVSHSKKTQMWISINDFIAHIAVRVFVVVIDESPQSLLMFSINPGKRYAS